MGAVGGGSGMLRAGGPVAPPEGSPGRQPHPQGSCGTRGLRLRAAWFSRERTETPPYRTPPPRPAPHGRGRGIAPGQPGLVRERLGLVESAKKGALSTG